VDQGNNPSANVMNRKQVNIIVAVVLVCVFTYVFVPVVGTGPDSTSDELKTSASQADSSGSDNSTIEAESIQSESIVKTNQAGNQAINQPAQTRATAFTSIVVSGRVSDAGGQPIENALVSDEINFGHVRTDATGNYQIEIKIPRFRTPLLNFLRSGYQESRIGVPLDQISEDASLVLDVQLREADNSTRVHGWVGNDLGQGLAGHTIELRDRSLQSSGTLFYAVISDEHGEFTFEGIRSGLEYRLDVESTAEYAGYSLEPFRVSQNTARMVIVLDTLELVDINGMIVGTDNGPIADFSVNIQNLSVDTPDRRITSDSSGFFRLEGFPAGEVRLSTSTPEYFKISGLTIHQNDYQQLTLTFDWGSYHLSGWVSDTNGVPLTEVRVTLNAIFEANGYHTYSYRSTLTDASGGFQFQRVGGVDHSLSIISAGYQTQVIKHAFTSYADSVSIRLVRDDN